MEDHMTDSEKDFPYHIEAIRHQGEMIYVRVEQTFYAVDGQGHTIDGPFGSKQDAIDTIKEVKEIKQ
tara:strand:- start:215 stop:415 length:201 start_codon:yes stop_codon:yes gene_type:complete